MSDVRLKTNSCMYSNVATAVLPSGVLFYTDAINKTLLWGMATCFQTSVLQNYFIPYGICTARNSESSIRLVLSVHFWLYSPFGASRNIGYTFILSSFSNADTALCILLFKIQCRKKVLFTFVWPFILHIIKKNPCTCTILHKSFFICHKGPYLTWSNNHKTPATFREFNFCVKINK